MSYIIVDDFRLGMDRRKQRISGVAGALWDGINGHITRGGDFERRKKFVAKYTLPTGGTFGLAQVNKQLFVFGNGSDPGVPPGVTYQECDHPSNAAMTEVLDVTTFSSKFYVVAAFADGSIYHYYDGARVTAWDTVAHANASNDAVAAALAQKVDLDPRYISSALDNVVTVEAAIAGTAFTISGSATSSQTLTIATPQANVTAVPETAASFTITVNSGDPNPNSFLTALTIGGVNYLGTVNWITSNAVTAHIIAAQINNASALPGGPPVGGPQYTAMASAGVVTVTAPPGLGTSANGVAVTAGNTIGGSIPDFSITTPAGTYTNFAVGTSIGSFAGGVNAIAAVAQVSTATVAGTYADAAVFTLTLNGTDYLITGLASGYGITALTYMGKVYSVTASLLEFSALDDASDWSGTGSGFINMTNQSDDNESLVGIRQYQNWIAIFSRFNTQIWVLAVDPANNTFQQSVQNTGALSTRSIIQYGNIDVFYLNDSGIRSLRARDASNAPNVADVGVAIDTFVQTFMDTLTGYQIGRACAVIEPRDGRYWLAMNNRIFVYSNFPGSKITAWTYYDLTDEIGTADISDMVRAGNRVYLRSGDTLYLYGGDTNQVYPDAGEIEATISVPYLSANKLATVKGVKSFDVGLQNTWNAFLLPSPADDTIELNIGSFIKSTYGLNDNPIQHPTPLFAVRMSCLAAGYASITNMAIHFDMEDER